MNRLTDEQVGAFLTRSECDCGAPDIGVGALHEPGCGLPRFEDVRALAEECLARGRERAEEREKYLANAVIWQILDGKEVPGLDPNSVAGRVADALGAAKARAEKAERELVEEREKNTHRVICPACGASRPCASCEGYAEMCDAAARTLSDLLSRYRGCEIEVHRHGVAAAVEELAAPVTLASTQLREARLIERVATAENCALKARVALLADLLREVDRNGELRDRIDAALAEEKKP